MRLFNAGFLAAEVTMDFEAPTSILYFILSVSFSSFHGRVKHVDRMAFVLDARLNSQPVDLITHDYHMQ